MIRVVSTPLVGSSLTRIAMSRRPSPWFADVPRTGDEWRARSDLMHSSLVHEDWLAQLQPALGGDSPASRRLLEARKGGFVVTAGQQPGLFGGPLYTWWKAFSALALADRLQEVTGVPVAPVFWAATDDSDFAEASVTCIATADGAERIVAPEPPGVGVALAQVRLGDVSEHIERLASAAGSGVATNVLDIVRASYGSEATVGGAFVGLLRALLEPFGISILDAAHPAVRSAAHPLLVRSLTLAGDVEAALATRSAELSDGGHDEQVRLVTGRTLAFSESAGRRKRVSLREAGEIASRAAPGTLGPNVLLRPIVERSILPTVAYLGGPAEIAYFAQVTAVAEALSVPAPVVLPRWSGFIVEPRIERILQRRRLEIDDFRDPHAVETRLAREAVPPDIANAIRELRDATERAVEKLRHANGELVTPGVLDGLARNVARRADRVERRYTASIKKRGNEALRDAAAARGALFPFGIPQERALNLMPLLARYGDQVPTAVLEEIRGHARSLA